MGDFAFRTLMALKAAFELMLRLVGPLFVVLATGLISTVIVIHFRAIIPYYVEYTSLAGLFHLALSVYLTINIFFNYFMTIFTSPGHPPETPPEKVEELERLRREPAPKKGQGFSRFCKACKKEKPERTHHCHVCKRCVMKMDHHCPWVSNCVGFYNHRYFVLFLLYLCLGCLYVAAMAFIPFKGSTNFKVPWKGWSSRGTIIFTFVISLSVSLAVGFMLIWHLYLSLTGQTTIEFYYNRYMMRQAANRGEKWENQYDLGYRKNFQLFYGVGKYWFSWLLPTFQPPPGDGIRWTTRNRNINTDDHHYQNNDHFV